MMMMMRRARQDSRHWLRWPWCTVPSMSVGANTERFTLRPGGRSPYQKWGWHICHTPQSVVWGVEGMVGVFFRYTDTNTNWWRERSVAWNPSIIYAATGQWWGLGWRGITSLHSTMLCVVVGSNPHCGRAGWQVDQFGARSRPSPITMRDRCKKKEPKNALQPSYLRWWRRWISSRANWRATQRTARPHDGYPICPSCQGLGIKVVAFSRNRWHSHGWSSFFLSIFF